LHFLCVLCGKNSFSALCGKNSFSALCGKNSFNALCGKNSFSALCGKFISPQHFALYFAFFAVKFSLQSTLTIKIRFHPRVSVVLTQTNQKSVSITN
jgi:hypothetical protein